MGIISAVASFLIISSFMIWASFFPFDGSIGGVIVSNLILVGSVLVTKRWLPW